MTAYNSTEILNNSFDATNSAIKVIGMNVDGIGYSNLSAAATANTKTIAAAADKKHHLCTLSVGVSVAAVTGPVTVTVADDATTVFSFIIPNAAAVGTTYNYSFDASPLTGTTNKNMVITVPSFGGSAKSLLSIVYYTS